MKLLVISNSHEENSHKGQIEAFRDDNFGIEVLEISHCRFSDPEKNFNVVRDFLQRNEFDVVLILTPKLFPLKRDWFETLVGIIRERPIFYYDGDPWLHSFRHLHKPKNKRKSFSNQMSWWASESEAIFTVAKKPHTEIFSRGKFNKVFYVPHTYCPIHFSQIEQTPPEKLDKFQNRVLMIGSNLASIPGITGVPGSFKRLLTAILMRKYFKKSFQLFGPGWPRWWKIESLPFANQGSEIRNSKFTVNWDHFHKHVAYTSDRLCISLLAGRPHVTTRHSDMNWLPSEEIGLYQVRSPLELLKTSLRINRLDEEVLFAQGLAGHYWVKERLSHKQLAQYMLTRMGFPVNYKFVEPWSSLLKI